MHVERKTNFKMVCIHFAFPLLAVCYQYFYSRFGDTSSLLCQNCRSRQMLEDSDGSLTFAVPASQPQVRGTTYA